MPAGHGLKPTICGPPWRHRRPHGASLSGHPTAASQRAWRRATIPTPPARRSGLKAKFGCPVMKALAGGTGADLAPPAGFAAVADRILFDARAPKGATRPGGLGAVFDWHLLEKLDLNLPFMVSGGLHADNVAEAVRVTCAGGVDVSSGVERSPGVKDPEMIRAFIRAARETEELIAR